MKKRWPSGWRRNEPLVDKKTWCCGRRRRADPVIVSGWSQFFEFPVVLWRSWLGDIKPVPLPSGMCSSKTNGWGLAKLGSPVNGCWNRQEEESQLRNKTWKLKLMNVDTQRVYLESKADSSCYQLLLCREQNRITDFFAVLVSLDLPIKCRWLTCLRMCIVGSNGVHLHIHRYDNYVHPLTGSRCSTCTTNTNICKAQSAITADSKTGSR